MNSYEYVLVPLKNQMVYLSGNFFLICLRGTKLKNENRILQIFIFLLQILLELIFK